MNASPVARTLPATTLFALVAAGTSLAGTALLAASAAVGARLLVPGGRAA
ncbi:MAG: hypothetical protein ACRYGA_12770 [Janthinobacterium lividum]